LAVDADPAVAASFEIDTPVLVVFV